MPLRPVNAFRWEAWFSNSMYCHFSFCDYANVSCWEIVAQAMQTRFFVWLTALFFFPNSLLPLPCLAPLANTFIRLCNVHCCRQSWDFVLNIGGERKKWSYLCVIRFHEKLVHPCCKLPVRATGLPPWKRSRNVLVLIPQYLLVHVVLDIMCEAGV